MKRVALYFFTAKSQHGGFSTAELVVSMAIIMLISAQTFFSFSQLNEGVALNRSAQTLALALRKTQNLALAIQQVRLGISPEILLIPETVGIHLDKAAAPQDYTSFVDRDDLSARDFRYTPATERIADTALHRSVRINRLCSVTMCGGVGAVERTIANVIFTAPEAAMFLTNDVGASIGDFLQIELISSTGRKKSILLRTSGQIRVQ